MNKEKPLITVLMATYNEKKQYLCKAIESILHQTYSNFEFLIFDDSTDPKSIEIIDYYGSIDKRIKIVRYGKKIGFVKSLNEGIRISKGDWIARMDSDDISFPNRFEEEIKYIREDVGVIASQCLSIDSDGLVLGKTIKTPKSHFMIRNYFLLGKNPVVHPTVLINKQKLIELGGYDENFIVAEDIELWIRFFESGFKIINISSPLLYYRLHPNNTHITKIELEKKLKCVYLVKYAYGEQGVLSQDVFNELLSTVSRDILYKVLQVNIDSSLFLKILKKMKLYPELPLLLLSLKYRIKRKKDLSFYVKD